MKPYSWSLGIRSIHTRCLHLRPSEVETRRPWQTAYRGHKQFWEIGNLEATSSHKIKQYRLRQRSEFDKEWYRVHAEKYTHDLTLYVFLWLGTNCFTFVNQGYFTAYGQSYDYPPASKGTLNDMGKNDLNHIWWYNQRLQYLPCVSNENTAAFH